MLDAKKIADKYVTRDGRPVGSPKPPDEAQAERSNEQHTADLATVAAFLLHHEYRDWWGGITARNAYHAFCRLQDLPPSQLAHALLDELSASQWE
jgi:hypothetical protein